MPTDNNKPEEEKRVEIKGTFGLYASFYDTYNERYNPPPNEPIQLSKPEDINQKMDDKVKELLGQKGYDALHKGTNNPETTAARDAYKDFMEKHLALAQNAPGEKYDTAAMSADFFAHPNKKGRELKKYQKEALKLHKAAIAEEKKSTSFRNVVFLQSCEFKPGPELDQRHCLHIGGPSGAGKSHARDHVIKTIMNEQGREAKPGEGNFFVSVDGGIDRDLSQVRNLPLSGMLDKGYKGGKDLQKISKTAVKKHVRNAVIASDKEKDKLNMVIPDTYANPLKKYGRALFSLLAESGFKQVFVTINPDQQQTLVGGNRRAWVNKNKPPKDTSPNLDLAVKPESKDYDPSIFDVGKKSSKIALTVFNFFVKDGRTFEINNDVQYYRKDPTSANGYTLCDGNNYQADVITNKRIFAAWEEYNNSVPEHAKIKDFNSWTKPTTYTIGGEKMEGPNYYFLKYGQSNQTMPWPQWKKEMEKQFGTDMTETTKKDNKLRNEASKALGKIAKEGLRERAASVPLPQKSRFNDNTTSINPDGSVAKDKTNFKEDNKVISHESHPKKRYNSAPSVLAREKAMDMTSQPNASGKTFNSISKAKEQITTTPPKMDQPNASGKTPNILSEKTTPSPTIDKPQTPPPTNGSPLTWGFSGNTTKSLREYAKDNVMPTLPQVPQTPQVQPKAPDLPPLPQVTQTTTPQVQVNPQESQAPRQVRSSSEAMLRLYAHQRKSVSKPTGDAPLEKNEAPKINKPGF